MRSWERILAWLASTPLARQAVETCFRTVARRRIAELDREAPEPLQLRTLLGLVHQAQGTRFGRNHDFRRIRTLADFRRLVPVRTRAELQREYGLPPAPGVTWPGLPRPSIIPDPGAQNDDHSLFASRKLVEMHCKAVLTALAVAFAPRRSPQLFSGPVAILGHGSAPVAENGVGSLEHCVTKQLPPSWRPFVRTIRPDIIREPAAIPIQFRRSREELPSTVVIGHAEELAELFHRSRTWPALSLVLYRDSLSGLGRSRLRAAIGSERVRLLELDLRPGAAIGFEDPRCGSLRLLSDCGAFLEFVPADEAGKSNPTRHAVAEVEAGQPYRLAISSPADLWACLVDGTVLFEGHRPLLYRRLVGERRLLIADVGPARVNGAHTFPGQGPHVPSTAVRIKDMPGEFRGPSQSGASWAAESQRQG